MKLPQNTAKLLERYRNGERYFGEGDFDDEVLVLANTCLEDIVFSPRSFLFADFSNSNLRNANFSECNIKTCDFRNANLENANFRNALLEATQFKGANLTNADFTGASCYSRVLAVGERPDW